MSELNLLERLTIQLRAALAQWLTYHYSELHYSLPPRVVYQVELLRGQLW